jgi:NTP pyrophosphatase (non-canonical NTP hydrolase)
MEYKDLEKFLSVSQEHLNNVQIEFDNYQKECFTERSPEFFCLELNGEAGELANLEKKQWKGQSIPHENFEDEAADVLIALMNYSNARKINLGQAVATKLKKIDEKRLNYYSKN